MAAEIPELRIVGEMLYSFGKQHQATGESRLVAGDGLVVSPASSSDDPYGTAVSFCSADAFYMDWNELDPSHGAPGGAFLQARATGTANGESGQPLGQLRIERVEEGVPSFEITADFSDIASPSHRIQVFDRGTQVLDLTGHTGVVARVSSWPTGLGKLGGTTECYISTHDAGTIFNIDGVEYPGDEIRVLAESSDVIVDSKSGFSVELFGIPALEIISETVTETPFEKPGRRSHLNTLSTTASH